MSRHSSGPRALPRHWSAMPAPPVNATRPSTISDLRWVRLLKRPSLYQRIGLYQATWQPPPSSVFRISAPMVARPDRIEQDLDAAARLRLPRQRRGEGAADVAGPVDVRLDRDRGVGGLDGLEHGRVERVAVVEQRDRVARKERRAARAGDRLDELLGLDRELVIEPVAGRRGRRCDEIAEQPHRRAADRPPPLLARHHPDEQQRPRPPRPEQPPGPGPEREDALGRAAARIDRSRGASPGRRRSAERSRGRLFGRRRPQARSWRCASAIEVTVARPSARARAPAATGTPRPSTRNDVTASARVGADGCASGWRLGRGRRWIDARPLRRRRSHAACPDWARAWRR